VGLLDRNSGVFFSMFSPPLAANPFLLVRAYSPRATDSFQFAVYAIDFMQRA